MILCFIIYSNSCRLFLANGLLISKRQKWYLAFAHFHPDDVTDLAVSKQNHSYHLDRHGKLYTKKSNEIIYQIQVTLALRENSESSV